MIAHAGRTTLAAATIAAALAAAMPALSTATPRDRTITADFINDFPAPMLGPGATHLVVDAQTTRRADGSFGTVRVDGDPDGAGPLPPFSAGGRVTCVKVSPSGHASLRYFFDTATGLAAPLKGGGVEIFLLDSGPGTPENPVDRSFFGLPKPAGIFELTAKRCDPPNPFPTDTINSGEITID